MPEDYQALTQKVEMLRDILASKASGGAASEEMFRALRAELRAHPDIGPLLPDWLRQVRTLEDWWGYIKPLYGTYAERRNFVSNQLDPALSYLEDMDPGLPPLSLEPVTLRQTPRPATPQENAQSLQSIFDSLFQGSAPSGRGPSRSLAAKVVPAASRTRVFVVDGHDHGPRDSVARLLERLELEAVILEEQPNKGRTIIEKFVDYSDVEYAVVVMTPDDMGGEKGGRANQRARQNVILELGFFIGKLGRDHVAAVVVEPVETPSDVEGVLYIRYDAIGGWKGQLAREIKAAGLPVDLNRLG